MIRDLISKTGKISTDNPVIVAVLIALSCFMAYAIAVTPIRYGLFALAAIIISGILLLSLINYKIPFYLAIFVAFGFSFVSKSMFYFFRMRELQLGTVVDVLLYVSVIALFLNRSGNKYQLGKFSFNLLNVALLVQLLYLIIQAFNPNLLSIKGYLFGFRREMSLLCVYIFAYYASKDRDFIKRLLWLWISLATVAAIYGLWQQFIGFNRVDRFFVMYKWVMEGRMPFYHAGFMRMFSLFSDPTTFGMFLAPAAIFSFVYSNLVKSRKLKVFLIVSAVLMIGGVVVSGTRTAYVMVVASIALYLMMTMNNKRTIIISSLLLFGFMYLLYGPIGNNHYVERVRSGFVGSDDESLALRDYKRNATQSYMYSQPLGGGINTTGHFGAKYSPDHYLTNYIIDSGYLKLGLETGWIGLLLLLFFYYSFLKIGLSVFYRCPDKEARLVTLGFIVGNFGLFISQYAQKAITQLPAGIFLFASFAIVSRYYDQYVKNLKTEKTNIKLQN